MEVWINDMNGIPVVWQRPDSAAILKDREALKAFSRYWTILRGKALSKFLIAKMIVVDYDPNDDEDKLWKLHEHAMKEFFDMLNDYSEEKIIEMYKSKQSDGRNLLNLKRDLAWKMLESCRFCEWRCKVNRYKSASGVCKLGKESYVASVFIHLGEEPELVPSYTIFFSHCNFKCVFCQNWDISQMHSGTVTLPEILARAIYNEWSEKRIRNVNWVGGEPTPNIHFILDVLLKLEANIPQIWNSNFYNSIEAMKILTGIIDLWLPDFKYGNNECALRLSKVPKYFDTITRNFKIINGNDEEVLIRHLVLPNHFECCTKVILEWIAENMTNGKVRVNVMGQYRPEYMAKKYPEISKRISYDEWKRALHYARGLGLSISD